MVVTLRKNYALERDRRTYRIDSINEHMVYNSARILASKVVRKNCPVQCNLGVVACVELFVQGFQMN